MITLIVTILTIPFNLAILNLTVLCILIVLIVLTGLSVLSKISLKITGHNRLTTLVILSTPSF